LSSSFRGCGAPVGASCLVPVLVGVPPGGAADFGGAVADADGPFGQVEGAVVPPAEQDAVVGVGGAAVGCFLDVVDLAPSGGDGAAGDDASAVAGDDRPSLEGVEDPGARAEAHDAAVVVEEDALDAAGAGGVERDRERH